MPDNRYTKVSKKITVCLWMDERKGGNEEEFECKPNGTFYFLSSLLYLQQLEQSRCSNIFLT